MLEYGARCPAWNDRTDRVGPRSRRLSLRLLTLPLLALALLAMLIPWQPALAQAAASQDLKPQDMKQVVKTAEAFLQAQLTQIPGARLLQVTPPDGRIFLPACNRLEGFTPPNTKLQGRTMVGVRCEGPVNWSLQLSATVSMTSVVVVARRALAAGNVIGPDDLMTQAVDAAATHPSVISDPALAVGKTLAFGVAAGVPLRTDMLRVTFLIKQNQTVRVMVKGNGFVVSAEGKALNNAGAGQIVNVRMPSGQTVQGLVSTQGNVEVNF